jgi:hypothetical protein
MEYVRRTKPHFSSPKTVCSRIRDRKRRFLEVLRRWKPINCRKGESMMYNWIRDIKRIRSLQSAQVRAHGQIAAVEDTSVGADATRH